MLICLDLFHANALVCLDLFHGNALVCLDLFQGNALVCLDPLLTLVCLDLFQHLSVLTSFNLMCSSVLPLLRQYIHLSSQGEHDLNTAVFTCFSSQSGNNDLNTAVFTLIHSYVDYRQS